MEFLDLAKKRYSVRSYTAKKVEKEKLDLILEAGRIAPTAANRQPQRILVIESKESLAKIAKAANTYDAPLVLVVCYDECEVWTRPLDQKKVGDIDATIVTDHMMMEAADLGLGSVWICYFKADILRAEFNIPASLVPVNILAIGYDAGKPASPNRHQEARKDLSATVQYETY